jgi:toxin ParE1/3/4
VHLAIHPKAQAEIIEAADWYDLRAEGLGDELLVEVDHAVAVILASPLAFPVWSGTEDLLPPVQRFALKRFQFYAIAYQSFADQVLVLSLVHTRRRPLYWLQRTQDR